MLKRLIASVLVLALTGGSLFAQEKKADKGPKLSFKGGDVYDFGNVEKGPIVKHVFEFTNTGNEPLIITDINPSCGCTNVEWDKKPILPGKKGKINVGLRTAEQHGNFFKDVYIQSNAANSASDKRYTIHIKGQAIESTKGENKPDSKEKK